MSHLALSQHPLTRTAVLLSPRAWQLLVVALCCLGAALLMPNRYAELVLFSVTGTLVSLTLMIWLIAARHARSVRLLHDQIAHFVALDAAPSFSTDSDGQIGYQNAAAQERFGTQDGQRLIRALGDMFASPSAVLYRLQTKAAAVGAAREDVVTRRGHVRLAVHQIGPGGFLWRLEEMLEHPVGGRGAEGLSLPMLTASKTGTILFMNEAMRRLIGGRVKTLDRVFTLLPIVSGE